MARPLIFGLCMLLSCQPAWAQERANILLLIIDDLRPAVGAYGDRLAHTPNIDRLAARGYVFENAFAPVPVCGASRAAMLSGRQPTTNRFVFYNARLDKDLPDALSLPGFFKLNGYHTLANGKVFDNTTDSESAWSEPVWSPTGAWSSSVPVGERGEHLQKAYLNNPPGVRGPAFERLESTDDAYPDGKIADKSISDLQRLKASGQPFLLAVGLRKPHLPFNVPERYWALHDGKQFPLPPTYFQRAANTPAPPYHASQELRQYAGIPPTPILDPALAQTLRHGYYAAVSYADAQVGKILRALDQLDLADNTIVVLLGDHGFKLGEHTMWTKHSLFDMALRSPLIIFDPTRAGGRVIGVTDFLDLYPTLAELTGLAAPAELDGVSLMPSLTDPDMPSKQVSFSRWFDGLSVRTVAYRYTEWKTEQGQVTDRMLFDLAADPQETRNVAEEPAYTDVVRTLSAELSAHDAGAPWSPLVRRVVDARSGAAAP